MTERKLCTGCAACEAVCPGGFIHMEEDTEGFLYPVKNTKRCTSCGICDRVCPVDQRGPDTEERRTKPGAFAAFHKDEAVREKSSSGGVFRALAESFIRNGGIVCGAAFDDHFEVVHRICRDEKDLEKLQTSKYSQSREGDCLKETLSLLRSGKKVLYTGTPCQTAAIAAAAGNMRGSLVLADLCCHGVPSPLVWRTALSDISKGKRVRSASFRNKRRGWRHYSLEVCFDSGGRYVKGKELDPMLRLMNSDLCLRRSCYECRFRGENREADITFADFWGVWKEWPDLYDDRGISLVLIHTDTGQKLLDSAGSSLVVKAVDAERAMSHNPSFTISPKLPQGRETFFKDMKAMSLTKAADRYCPVSTALRVKAAIKDAAGIRR